MARAPFNVLIFPYIDICNNEFEYVLFKRADTGFWQEISGGGEDNETPLESARRETYEETGISVNSEFMQLDTVFPVPVTEFSVSYLWGDNIYVIPQYTFGVKVYDRQITLSNEHTEYRWLRYEQAYEIVEFDGNKIAIWELNRKLKGLGPRD